MYVCVYVCVCVCVCVCMYVYVCVEVLDPQTDANNTASVKVDIRRISLLLNLDRIVSDQAVLCECPSLPLCLSLCVLHVLSGGSVVGPLRCISFHL